MRLTYTFAQDNELPPTYKSFRIEDGKFFTAYHFGKESGDINDKENTWEELELEEFVEEILFAQETEILLDDSQSQNSNDLSWKCN